jgi:capsular exopolysaccharide synthesis family protein
MTLEHYWLIIVKQWRLILACFILVGAGAYIGSHLLTPIYQATALVRVNIHSTTESTNYNNLLASDQLVQTEAALATSNPILHKVATHYHGLTYTQLARATTATIELNTQLFKIDVQDVYPDRAANLANDIANTLIDQQSQDFIQQNTLPLQNVQKDVDKTNQNINTIATRTINLEIEIANLARQPDTQMQIKAIQAQVVGLQNQSNRLQQHYDQIQPILTQLEITNAQSQDFLSLAQPALASPSPVRPQILLNTILGLLTGLALGLLLAIIFERLNTHVSNPDDIAQLLSLPILTTVWYVGQAKNMRTRQVHAKMNSINAAAYRILRINIGFLAIGRTVRSLVVTSPMPNDGKSTVASNLAIFMAKAKKKTLLIDADMYHPILCEKFALEQDVKGLSDAIMAYSQAASTASEEISLDPYIHATSVENLYVMPAGVLPPNPSELLDSIAMDNFLAALTDSDIEMIIIDAPPLLGLADASIIASKVDGTIVVADTTRVKKEHLQQVKMQLLQTGTYVLGCVINKQRLKPKSMPYSYYYTRDDEAEGSIPQISEKQDNSSLPDILSRSETKLKHMVMQAGRRK